LGINEGSGLIIQAILPVIDSGNNMKYLGFETIKKKKTGNSHSKNARK
jgi:hypothetical protein